MRRSGQDRIKGDQRILGGHDFVTEVLAELEDQFSHKHKLKAMGYDFGEIVERTCNLFQFEKDYVFGKGWKGVCETASEIRATEAGS